MYNNEDLSKAVKEGIFTQSSLNRFKLFIEKEKNKQVVDKENFEVLTGFNDIFVLISSLILLYSANWIASDISSTFASIVMIVLSWGLAEFFVRKRKMTFPAIMLLLIFVGSVFGIFFEFSFNADFSTNKMEFAKALVIALIATFLHWKRFHVPITVALGIGIFSVLIMTYLMSNFAFLRSFVAPTLFLFGVVVFIVAMYWDSKDKKRVSNESQVAFWLHLLASPLMIHSLFLGFNVFNNELMSVGIITILISYIFISIISLVIDRRALMVSSLLYVIYALYRLVNAYGIEGHSFAIGGIVIGIGLLLLTAFWTRARVMILRYLPIFIQNNVRSV